jgi:chromosome condensin MukBEF MukE localization factor
MRKYLSHAFSDRSLSEQEEMIAGTILNFVHLAGERGQQKGGWDIAKAYEMMTFDIIGDLAFGESFGGLEGGE